MHMKNKSLLIVVFLLSIFAVSAQSQQAVPGRQGTIARIYGKIVDASGKGIPNISVMALRKEPDTPRTNKELLLKAASTLANGDFSLDGLTAYGTLLIKISGIGFKPLSLPVTFGNAGGAGQNSGWGGQNTNMDKDLGNIVLTENDIKLAEVTITATRLPMQIDMDKKTFNVAQNLVSIGGTAIDVMRNVPSVQVDVDGNVKMRNATPQIYIDGRPTALTMDQIPADGIASVEVITNPSAKYDAAGGNAGIVNIVLKKNKQKGYNGNLIAGTDSRAGKNLVGSLNLRQDKINITASLIAKHSKDRTRGTTDRYNFSNNNPENISQNSHIKTNDIFTMGKLGLDYFVTNRTTLSLSGLVMYGKFKPNETIGITTENLVNTARSSYGRRVSNTKREIDGTALELSIKHNFPKNGREWTADVNYSTKMVDGNSLINNEVFNVTGNISNPLARQNFIEANNKVLVIQSDYSDAITPTTKLEAGLRAQISPLSNQNDSYLLLPGAADFEKIENDGSSYKVDNEVYAAYLSISSNIKNFGYQIGIRAESSSFTGNLHNGQQVKNNYPLSLFPSVFLTQKLKKDQQLQLSVTRRINRPTFYQLTPYTDYTDNLNINSGNPNLLPEFTNAAEFSYMKTFSANQTFLVSAYYKKTNNLIIRYMDMEKNPSTGQDVYINRFNNADYGSAYGFEITTVNRLAKFWDFSLNANLYRGRINSNNIPTATVQQTMWSFFGKMNNTFKLPMGFDVQLSAEYQGKTNLPVNNVQSYGPRPQAQSASQGYIRPFFGADMAIKKSFGKQNAKALTLGVTDIFRSRKSDQFSEGTGFVQDYYRLVNPQLVKLSFMYRFGKADASLLKRKNTKRSMENNSDL